jgi:DNA-binding NarL/FixJ family response regulator
MIPRQGKPRPTVVLAEDHRLVAEGLAHLLADECVLIESVGTVQELVAAALRHAPDVLVMDVNLDGEDAIEAFAALKAKGCRSRAVFLTANTDASHLRRAIAAGGMAFVLKSAAGSDLSLGIRSSLEGRTYIAGFDAAELVRPTEETPATTVRRVTSRQKDVLRGFARGLSAKQIAEEMNLSQRTVEYHKYELMKLAGVNNGPALILWGERAGLLALARGRK